jgi:hypothetical protein
MSNDLNQTKLHGKHILRHRQNGKNQACSCTSSHKMHTVKRRATDLSREDTREIYKRAAKVKTAWRGFSTTAAAEPRSEAKTFLYRGNLKPSEMKSRTRTTQETKSRAEESKPTRLRGTETHDASHKPKSTRWR